MPRFRLQLSGLLLAASTALVACRSTPSADGSTSDRRAEEAALRAADLAWSDRARALDLDGVVGFMAADGETLGPNEPLATGHAAIRASWQGLLALPDVKLSWKPERVEVARSGDLGFTRGTYVMSFTGPDGQAVKDAGKYVEVWRKVGGQWRCVVDAYSSDLPAQ